MANKSRGDLERDIFGGSDSELSSDEEQVQVQRKSPRPHDYDDESSAGASPAPSGDEDFDDDKAASKKKVKRPRQPKDDAAPRKTRKRKRKVEITQEELDQMDPTQARKRQLDMQIDNVLKSKRSNKTGRRKKNDEEDPLDRFADEEVNRLRETMLLAADEDVQSNKDKLPATAKLRMLPQVMEVLQKASLAQSILDNNLLEAVTRWLEPLPDKSLPALNIQNAFFEALTKLYIDTASLKDSGLGKVVLFYTKCKRVTTHIQRIANDLVSTWSRPIIKRSASYRDMEVQLASAEPNLQSSRNQKLSAILQRAAAEVSKRTRPNAVSIPTSSFGTYKFAPRSGLGNSHTSVDMDVERRRKNAERLRSLTKNLASTKAGR